MKNILKILTSLAFLGVGIISYSQENRKNVVRLIPGVSVVDGIDKKYSAGPSVNLEYQRNLSSYFGLNFSTSLSTNHYGDHNDFTAFFVSAGTMVTPFPKFFRWFKFGVNLSLQHGIYSDGFEDHVQLDDNNSYWFYSYRRTNNYRWGLHFPIRLYAIDTEKYELFVSFRKKTMFYHGLHKHNAIWGLGFGVKF